MKVFFSAVLLLVFASIPGVAESAAIMGGTLNPRNIPKYATPIVIPPEMAKTGAGGTYDIEVVPHNQQILPPVANDGTPLSATPVWTYAAFGNAATRNYPAFTIEVTRGVPAQIKWRNNLVDATGAFLPHLLSVDRSLHWANPEKLTCMGGSGARTDCRPAASNGVVLQQPYTGPVPLITHVHGAHVGPESDGYPEAWYLPNANNIPAGYATTGRLANQFGINNTVNGTATFIYPNDQYSTTLWYHDHTLGMTRLNVYAGPAGFYLVREPGGGETGLVSGTLPGPRPGTSANPFDHLAYREIPLAIQDRSFNVDAVGNTTLYYPNNRAFFEGLQQPQQLKIPFIGDAAKPSDISAIWNPEFFGNVMVVNGVSWPFLSVEPERYRFRLLNGCNSRVLNLSLVALSRNGKVLGEVPFYQIGSEQGLLPDVVRIVTGQAVALPGDGSEPALPTVFPAPGTAPALLMGLAERADVIVDFSNLPVGTVRVRMLNTAPDAPFGGFPDIPSDPTTTGQVMDFVLVANNPLTVDNSTPPRSLMLANLPAPVVPDGIRNLALIEEESSLVCVKVNPAGKVQYIDLLGVMFDPTDPNNACVMAGGVPFAPKEAVVGTINLAGDVGTGVPQMWGDTIRTTPLLDDTETWQIWNFTMDAHPIHLHLVKYRVVGRELFTPDPAVVNQGTRSNVITPPEPWETGYKDTALMYPGQITHVQALFDIAGLYVWHCHIVEHEDNEMMVPYCVNDPGVDQTVPGSVQYCGPQAPPGVGF